MGAGCATGEEVYSLAMLMREHTDGLRAVPQVQIFASDIDDHALAVAPDRPTTGGRCSTPSRLNRRRRFFTAEGGSYVVTKRGARAVRVLASQRDPRPAVLAHRPGLLS